MSRVYWSVLIGIAFVLVGLFLGVTGLLILPLIGVPVIIAVFFWLAERKAHHKDPVE